MVEIEKILLRFGADRFMAGYDGCHGYVAFMWRDRAIRMSVDLPSKEDFRRTPGGRKNRSDTDTVKAWEQACREQWRALALLIKAKLVGVESGVKSFEDEFLAYTMLPDGGTVSQWIQPQIDNAIVSGSMPKLLMPGD